MASADPELNLDGELGADNPAPVVETPAQTKAKAAQAKRKRTTKAPFGRAGVAVYTFVNRRFALNPGPDVIRAASRAEEARDANSDEHDLIIIALPKGEGDIAAMALRDWLAGK